MATAPVVWADSFGSGDLSLYTGIGSIETGAGRGGRNCLNVSGSPTWISKMFPIVTSATRQIISAALETAGGGLQVGGAAINVSGGYLYVTRDSDNTHLTTKIKAWTDTSYVHVALAVTRDASAGTVDIWLNESLVYSVSGVNTTSQDPTPGFLNTGGFTSRFSDVIIQLSSTNTDLPLGDRAVIWLPPTADGTHHDFTPKTGTDHHAMVDEAPPDGDGSYNASATVGNIDTFAMADLATSVASIDAVVAKWNAAKTDAGTRAIAPLLRVGGTDYAGTGQNLGTAYGQQFQVYDQSPATSSAWSVTELNGAEAGVKVTA